MSLPENGPIILKGDKIEFRIAEGKTDDDKVKELLISTASSPTSKFFSLDELSNQQRQVIRDLQEGNLLDSEECCHILNYDRN